MLLGVGEKGRSRAWTKKLLVGGGVQQSLDQKVASVTVVLFFAHSMSGSIRRFDSDRQLL